MLKSNNRPIFLEPSAGDWVKDCQTALANGFLSPDGQTMTSRAAGSSFVWGGGYEWMQPYAVENGVLTVPVRGVLLKGVPGSTRYATGYGYIRAALMRGLDDSAVSEIVFSIDSPGGYGPGLFELSDFIFESRGTKALSAHVDDAGYSAAFAIGSATDEVVVDTSGGVGSVGVVMMVTTIDRALAEMGVDVHYFYKGSHKIDGTPYAKLSDGAREVFDVMAERDYSRFVDLVARNRAMTAEAVRATEALIYDGEDAVTIGFADRVHDFGAGLPEPKRRDPVMTTTTTQASPETPAVPDTSAIQAEARAEAQARMKTIQTSPEAVGREGLAQHLAFDTEMTAEAAVAVLKASPKSEALPAAKAETAEDNGFLTAMKNDDHPDVGDGKGGDAEPGIEGEKGFVNAIDHYAKYTGVKLRSVA